MTDREKLEYIEKVARECFSEEWRNALPQVADLHRAQALANIFCFFEYGGLTVAQPKPKDEKTEDKVQITFDDILN